MKIRKLRLNIKLDGNWVASIFFFLFQVTYFMYTSWFPQMKYVSAGLGIMCFAFVFILKRGKNSFILPVIVYTCTILSALYTGNHRLEEFIMPLMFIGPSMILIHFKISYKFARLYFWLNALIYVAILIGLIDLNVFGYYSDNYISINILNLSTILFITSYQNNIKFNIYPSIAVAIVCYLSMGRASIIVGTIQLILFFLYFLYYRRKEERRSNFLIVIFVTLTLMVGYLIVFEKYIYPLLGNFFSTHKYDYGFKSMGRSMLLQEYWNRMNDSIGNFVFGVPIRNNDLFLSFGSNWHSSYLRLHSFFGLPGVLIVMISACKAAAKFSKENKVFLILICVLLIRIATDSAAANGILDPILYYFFYHGWRKQRCFKKKLLQTI